MQVFKGDELELKMIAVGTPILEDLSLQKDLFFEGAYQSYALGDLIYDSGLSPLSNAIAKDIFRTSFNEIFQSFTVAGTFESYLEVFRKIFGPDVIVEFEVPGPGQLNINIAAVGVEQSNFIARRIVNNAYVYEKVIDHEGDGILFQTIKGFQTQYELEQMLFEMVPAGIYTVIDLQLGS